MWRLVLARTNELRNTFAGSFCGVLQHPPGCHPRNLVASLPLGEFQGSAKVHPKHHLLAQEQIFLNLRERVILPLDRDQMYPRQCLSQPK